MSTVVGGDELSFPSTVTIPDGQDFVKFTVTVLADDLDPSTVTVLLVDGFGAGGYNNAYAELVVNDTPDFLESNDTFDTATDLGRVYQDGVSNLSIHNGADEDFFKFTATATGQATVEVVFTHTEGDLDVNIWASDQTTQIAQGISEDDNETVVFDVDEGESYFIQVLGFSGATNEYGMDITVKDRFEANETANDAAHLGTVTSTAGINEADLSIHSPSDFDVFSFDAGETGTATVDLTFTHADGDIQLFIYDSDENYIDSSESNNDNESVSFEAVAGETYFALVVSDSEPNTFDLAISLDPVSASVIGESGIASPADGEWFQIDFANTYVDPVVVAGPLSFNGADPATIRVRNVTSTGFEARVLEWDYLNQIHGAENFSYLVVESGTHTLENGAILQAGNASNVNHEWDTVNFGSSFGVTPIVLTQTSSFNGPSAVVTRHDNINTSSFDVFLQEEQGANQIHANETVSWIAIEPTVGDGFEAGITPDAVTHNNFTINFGQNYSNPAFVAAVQSFDGADPTGLRRAGLSGSDATVFLQEETSADAETNHIDETVGYVTFEPGSIFAQGDSEFQQLGESGTLNLTHEWTTVNLDQTYVDPVVIMGAGANTGSDPYTFRVRNVTANSFEVQVDEWDYLNGLHNAVETVSYLVVESGEHELVDGTKFVAANVPVDHNLSTFDLSPYGFSGPIVLSQTVTVNGASAVTTRHSNVTPTEFSIQLQEEEAGNQIHSVETVSLFIIESGTGDSDGQLYEGGFVDLTHNEANFGFFNSYSSTPLLFSQMQSKVGSDPGVIRHTTLDASGFGVYIDEEQSADSETNHNAVENTGVFAMEEGDIFGNSFSSRSNIGLQLISSEPGKDDLNGSLGNFVKTPATNPGDNDVAFSKDGWFASLSDLDQKTLAGAVEGSVVRVPHEAMVGLDQLFESNADDEKTDSVLEFDLI